MARPRSQKVVDRRPNYPRAHHQACVSLIPGVTELLADKGYDTDAFRAFLRDNDIKAVIPVKSNRKRRIRHDKKAYKGRNVVEASARPCLALLLHMSSDLDPSRPTAFRLPTVAIGWIVLQNAAGFCGWAGFDCWSASGILR